MQLRESLLEAAAHPAAPPAPLHLLDPAAIARLGKPSGVTKLATAVQRFIRGATAVPVLVRDTLGKQVSSSEYCIANLPINDNLRSL